jgi:post-segregation antitoxin (ccd killing protein)
MALQLPQTLLSQVANFGQQPMQNLQQGLLTPVQVAAQQPAGIGALVSGLGGMFGIDTRSPAQIQQAELAKLKRAEQMASLEQTGQGLQQSSYALRKAANLGEQGRELIRQRDIGLISDAELVDKANAVANTRNEVVINKTLNAYEKALKSGNQTVINTLEERLLNAGVEVTQLEARREAAAKEGGRIAPPTLIAQLESLAASGDMLAKSHLENISGGSPQQASVNSALSYVKDQVKPKAASYLTANDFANADSLANAQQAALMNGDVGVAGQLGQMREQVLASEVNLNAADVVEIATAVNPNYKDIKQRQLSLGQAKELLMLPGAAGSAELARRSISDIQRSDAKSLEAMRQFARSASIDQRIRDSLNMFVSGELSDATTQDYINIADKLSQYYTNQINQTALQLLQSGNKEDIAAGTALLNINSSSKIKFLD